MNRSIPLVRRKLPSAPQAGGTAPAGGTTPSGPGDRRAAERVSESVRVRAGWWVASLRHRGLGTRLAALALALLVLTAVFADWLAGDSPILLISRGGISFLPSVTEPARFAGKRSDQIGAMLEPGTLAVWPLVRSGPSIPSEAPAFAAPSLAHPLGTDAFRRDVFARLVHGTRIALGLGAVAAVVAAVLGFVTGAGGAALGGSWDGLIERATEVAGIYPAVIVIALMRAVQRTPTLGSLFFIVTLLRWAEMARIARVITLRSFAEDWALAARALGATRMHVVVHQIARAAAAPVLVSTVFSFAGVVLTESALSFLGLGVPPAFASWGEMMGEISWGAGPAVVLLPALLLGTTVGSLHLLADAARRALDPRSVVERPLG